MSLAKRVFGATALITIAGGVSRLFSIVTAPILTRLLGPEPYGQYALAATVTSFGTTVALLGIDMGYSRFFFGGTQEKSEKVEVFVWRWALMGALMIGPAAGLIWSLHVRETAPGMGWTVPLLGLTVMFSAMQTMAQTRARLQSRYAKIAGSIILAGILSTAVTLITAALWSRSVLPLFLGGLVMVMTGPLMLGTPSPGRLMAPSGLPWPERINILRLGVYGSVTAPMYWLLSSVDRWLIQRHFGSESLGVYAMAYSLGMLGLLLNSAVVLTWFPEASRAYEESPDTAYRSLGRLWYRLIVLLGVVWLAVTAAGGDVIRLITAPEFHPGARYVPWIAAASFFYGAASLANTGLVLKKDMRPTLLWWPLGALSNGVLNLLLIPRLGPYGAGISLAVAYGLIATGVIISSERRMPLGVSWIRLIGTLLLIGAAGALMAPAWGSPLVSLSLKFPIGLGIAALLAVRVAPDWVSAALGWVRRIGQR